MLDWQSNLVTQRYLETLQEEGQARRVILASGGAKRESTLATGEEYTRVLTQAEVYESMSQPMLEDILTEEEMNENS